MTKGQKVKYAALALLVLLLALLAWQWSSLRQTSDAGTAYAARIVCSCRYVAGRPLESCEDEVAGDAGLVHISEDAEAKRITGSVPLLGRNSAIYRPGFGCVMEPE